MIEGAAEAFFKGVENDHLVPGIDQRPRGDRTDVAGAPGHEHFHEPPRISAASCSNPARPINALVAFLLSSTPGWSNASMS